MASSTHIPEICEPCPPGGAESWSLAASRAYCECLARSHYENFTVASWLLPRRLRQHFYNVYAYCRIADDLADESAGGQTAIDLLDGWQAQLEACFRGDSAHPVFVALAETIAEFEIPIEPFRDLLVAFRQDQLTQRYETRDELLDYCRNSANPVGRIVLHLARRVNSRTLPLSDAICTGLQLANFWQDVARDWQMGRRYLPAETMRRFRLSEQAFASQQATPEFRVALACEVDEAERLLREGAALANLIPPDLRFDIWLFAQGGLAILRRIRQLDFDVWSQRPTVTKGDRVRLLAQGILRHGWGRFLPGAADR